MNTTTTMSATMQATVCNVERNQLLVCDHATQEAWSIRTKPAASMWATASVSTTTAL